jgi:AhpD family alkylhydroperoxidase
MASYFRSLALAAGLAAAAYLPYGTAIAQDATATPEATLQDIEKTWGFVPGFVKLFPSAALPGAWAELKALESESTALTAKEKALISIAVAAQIPCQYCIWLDTRSAWLAGASDQEVQEAIAMAAVTRHWSTVLHGNGVDFAALQAEFAELDKAAQEARTKTMAGQ